MRRPAPAESGLANSPAVDPAVDPAVGPAVGPSLRAKALAWLAQREHSTLELRGKLQRWAQSRGRDAAAEGLEALLEALQAAGHLSDTRFAHSRVHTRAPRLGNLRIEHELRRNGVSPDEALRQVLRASELERARAVWARRFGRPAADLAERARQARFLAGRGFSADTIGRVIGADPSAD